jgi:hypothetical protein
MPVILAPQEERSSKPAQANSSRDLISKMPNIKRAGVVAQGVGSEFKSQYHTHTHTHTKKNRKKEKK